MTRTADPAGLHVFRSPAEWAESPAVQGRRSALSIGIFDGIHLGHQHIFTRVVQAARAARPALIPGVVTFDPHPLRLLRPQQAPPLIATLEQRLAGFRQFGLEAALLLPFDRALSLLSPEDFVSAILVDKLRAAVVFVGENFRFGHRQAGDVKLLEALGARHGFTVELVSPVREAQEIVSSTAIRRAVQQGDPLRAAQFLGRPFSLTGKIQPGAGRGRTLLFPTLNLAPEQQLLPRTGVYVTETVLNGKRFPSVTNVGVRPTVDSAATQIVVESHLLDFDQRITAGSIEVRFLRRLRDEIKFPNVDALRAQIARDIEQARAFFADREEGTAASG